MSYLNLSEVNHKKENFYKAITYALEGIKIAEEIGADHVLKQGYSVIRYSYEETNQFKKAYEYSELLLKLKDSMFTKEKQDKISELEAEYNTAQKEKENELLKKNNSLNQLKLERSKFINYGTIGLLCLFFIVGYFVYRAYKQKNQAYAQLEEKSEEILAQSEVIEQKNKDILDSLNYAERIQKAILPPMELINDALPNSFFFYRPKDIVSGDFYWVEKVKNKVFFAAVDCTGHGVPGAFMSIIGYNGLNQAMKEGLTKPNQILDYLNDLVSNTLHQSQIHK